VKLIAGAIAGLLVLILILLHTGPVQGRVLEAAQNYLRTKYDVDLQVEKFGYNLLTFTLEISGVTARAASRKTAPPFLRIDAAHVDLALPRPWTGEFTIENVRLVQPQFHVILGNAEGNLPQIPAQEKAESTSKLLVASGTVGRASFRLEDPANQLVVDLPDWSVGVMGDAGDFAHAMHLLAGRPGVLTWRGETMPIQRVELDSQEKLGSLILDRLVLNVGQSRIVARGSWHDFETLDMNATVDLVLAEVARFTKLAEPIEGRLHSEASFKGPLKNLEIAAGLKATDVAVRRLRQLTLEGKAAWADGRLSLDAVKVSSPMLGSVTAEGNLAIAKGKGESRVSAQISRLHLQPVSRELKLPVVVASTLSGSIQAKLHELDWRTAAGTADLQMASSAPVSGDVIPVSGSVHVEGREQDLTAEIRELATMGSRFTGTIRVDDLEKLGGQLRGAVSSLDVLGAQLNSLLKREAAPPLDGTVEVTADLAGTLRSPIAAVHLASPDLGVRDLRGISLNASATYSVKNVELQELRAEWQGQTVTARGNVGLEGVSPSLNLDAQVQQASIAAVLRGLGRDVPLEGNFDLEAHVRGTASSPQALASLRTGPLRAYGEHFDSLLAEAGIANQQLELTKIELQKKDGQLVATGEYGLTSRAYELNAKAENLQLTGLTLPGRPPIRGSLTLSAEGSGSIDNPILDAELTAANVRFGDREFGNVTADAHLENQLAKVNLNAPAFALVSSAEIGTKAPYPARFQLEANGTDLAVLQIQIDGKRPLTGRITAQAEGSGTLSEWERGTISLNATDMQLIVEGHEVRNVEPLQLRFDKGVLEIQSAQLATGESRINASGSLPLDPGENSRAIQAKGELSLPALVAFAPQLAGMKAEGTLRLSAEVRGSLRKPLPSGTVEVDGASIQHTELRDALRDLQLAANYENERIDLEKLSARLGEATITARGVVPLREGEAHLEAAVGGLQLSSLRKAPEGLGSRISFQLEGKSPRIQDLTAAQAKVTFNELEIAYRDLQLKQEVPASIAVEHGVARIETLRMKGPESALEASGTVSLDSPQTLDLTAKGSLNTTILALFADSLQAEGISRFELAVRGAASAPEVEGFLEMKDGQIAATKAEIVGEDLNLRLDLETDRVTISKLTGTLNGGELRGSGYAEYSAKGLGNINIDLNAKDSFFNIPEGLKTQVQADLKVRNVEDQIEIGGKVQIVEGAYREPLNPQTQLLAGLRSSRVELVAQRNPALEKIRFNIEVNTVDPILLQNNMMEMAVNANVRVVGDFYRPGLLGRMSIEEGGELYLNERRYFLERGNLSFVNPRQLKPDLDILATTRVNNVDITLNLSGNADDYSANFTSDSNPELSQPDLISLVLTGRTVEKASGNETNIARDQALSLVTGAAASQISAGAQRTLGLSEVRIEPNLISPESEPGARLTIGQSLTDALRFIYSMNLRDSSDQIQILEWDVTRRFVGRSTRQEDNTYRFDFNHALSFGGPEESKTGQRKPEPRKIGEVRFEGNSVFDDRVLSGSLDLKSGSDYSFFKVHKNLDNIRKFYTDREYLEARVRTSRKTRDQIVDLIITIREGPKLEFVFEGYDVSGRTRKRVHRLWREGFIDVQRVRETTEAIRNELARENFHQPELRHDVTVKAGVKRVLFEIEPGTRYRDLELVFEGAVAFKPSKLREILNGADLIDKIPTNPGEISDFLTKYYQQEGYLSATVTPPRYDLDPKSRTGRIVTSIREGPLFHLAELRFEGNDSISAQSLDNALLIGEGDVYKLQSLQDSISAIEEVYWRKGYNDVEINYALERHEAQGTVDVAYQIQEGEQELVREVIVQGNDQTSENMIRTQLEVAPGEVLDYSRTNESRRNLYETGAYSLVDIQRRALDGPIADGTQKPVALDVKVRELKPHNFSYGASYDTERGPGVIVDYLNRNSLGAARTLGFRARYDSEFRELRTYFGQPLLRRFPVRTTIAGFVSREIQQTFITDRRGFSLQQESRPWENTLISYGYRFERTHTFDKDPDSVFQLAPFNVAPLTFTYTHDTRDEILDATRGSMFSHAFDYAPRLLGSDVRFIRYFGQYFRYVPLGAPMEIPLSRGAVRPRLVYAGGVRVGLGKGLDGQDLVRTERFFAGGSTTLRGFDRDAVGPSNIAGPLGGDAVFITNNELRFPLFSIFDGVGFVDIGNVYRRISDFNPFDVRKSAGLGLRVRTPYFLLRVDYGFILDRKPDEPLGGFYFSIGQAF
jgi:outer membrane protein assembly complex protein YaeT